MKTRSIVTPAISTVNVSPMSPPLIARRRYCGPSDPAGAAAGLGYVAGIQLRPSPLAFHEPARASSRTRFNVSMRSSVEFRELLVNMVIFLVWWFAAEKRQSLYPAKSAILANSGYCTFVIVIEGLSG